jgi:hypothetical protein
VFAVLAVIAFAIALILNIAGGKAGTAAHVTDAEIIGFICIAAHLLWGVYPWRHTP